MPFSAFAYELRPGTGAELPAVGLPGPVLASPALAMSTFVRGDVLLRVLQYPSGTTDPVGQAGSLLAIAEADRLLAPFLAGPPPAGGLRDSLLSREMTRVQQRIVSDAPGASLSALYHGVRPGYEARIMEAFEAVRPQRRPMLRNESGGASGVLHGVAVFVWREAMVRVVSYDGDVLDVARYMAARPGRAEIERVLEPLLTDELDTSTEAGFLSAFSLRLMRPVAPAALTGDRAR